MANLVNSHADRASTGFRGSPKQTVHPPSASQSAAFLISKSGYLCPVGVSLSSDVVETAEVAGVLEVSAEQVELVEMAEVAEVAELAEVME